MPQALQCSKEGGASFGYGCHPVHCHSPACFPCRNITSVLLSSHSRLPSVCVQFDCPLRLLNPSCASAQSQCEVGRETTDGELVSRREAAVQAVRGVGGMGIALGFLLAGGAVAEEGRRSFFELEGSGGVKALDIREGMGAVPKSGDRVEIHYYARLAAKQGWRFDATYDHKDGSGNPEPYVFTMGSGTVIAGLDAAVRSMKEGGVRRAIIPPLQGYQNTTQGPIPPNFFDRQRLYTTVFNQTRLANGEGSTLGTVIFDIELLKVRPP